MVRLAHPSQGVQRSLPFSPLLRVIGYGGGEVGGGYWEANGGITGTVVGL